MARLTKTFIDNVQPPASGYYVHWDDRVPGYGLRVTANGVRAFVVQGRVRGRSVVVTLGKFGIYTEDKARAKAQRVLQQMRDGIDCPHSHFLHAPSRGYPRGRKLGGTYHYARSQTGGGMRSAPACNCKRAKSDARSLATDRQLIINTCAEAMRNESDPTVRARAYDTLVRIGVVRKL